jgi:hypothetical protein
MVKQEIENVLWLIARRIKEIKQKFGSNSDICTEAIKEWEHIKDNLIKKYDIKEKHSFNKLNLK